MKLRIIFFSILLSSGIISAQGITDALRYSGQTNPGNARYAGMGGAMGALGATLSALEDNPAGGAVFSNSIASFSTAIYNDRRNSDYYGSKFSETKTNFDFNQAGGVFVLYNEDESSIFRKLVIGATYNMVNNFYGEQYATGIGKQSLTSLFLSHAQGVPLENINLQPGESISSLYRYLGQNYGVSAQTAFLGYQGFLFDPVNPDDPLNSDYLSNVQGDQFNQQFLQIMEGYQSKFTINISAQLTDKFYVGMNVNTHSIDYRQGKIFTERNSDSRSLVTAISYEESLAVFGTGVSAQFGGIARLQNNLRVGIHYDTPIWFRISEETTQLLETKRLENNIERTAVVNPQVINVFEDYKFRSPGKMEISLAYIFGKSGLLSLDYGLKNYGWMKFSPSNDHYFRALNQSISDELGFASSLKAGGEYRWKSFSFRTGAQYHESPYKKEKLVGNSVGFSLGAGYASEHITVDFAFTTSKQKNETQLYSQGLTDRFSEGYRRNNFLLSIGFTY